MLLKCDKCGAEDAKTYVILMWVVPSLDRRDLVNRKVDLCDGCRMTTVEFIWSLKGGNDGGDKT